MGHKSSRLAALSDVSFFPVNLYSDEYELLDLFIKVHR